MRPAWPPPPGKAGRTEVPRRASSCSLENRGTVDHDPLMTRRLIPLPAGGPAREALRRKGQFWTPAWLADVMVRWVLADGPARLFDPAVGPGTFLTAARRAGFRGGFAGFEPDGRVLEQGASGLSPADRAGIVAADFLAATPEGREHAIVSNPPYIRHHRLDPERKQALAAVAEGFLGFALDGRTGLHVHFLLRCLALLAPGGRLAFLLPADVFEGVSAEPLWRAISGRFRLEAVIAFGPEAAPFPGVDTNALVVLISHCAPSASLAWLRASAPEPGEILAALGASSPRGAVGGTQVWVRDRDEAITTGLSRPARPEGAAFVRLGELARVVRGVATGANDFFFLTASRAAELGLDRQFLHRGVGRTRDCLKNTLTTADLDALDRAGRATWLLRLEREAASDLPTSLRAYLEGAERLGIPDRHLLAARRPWYRMERRPPPPILFAYLGRRNCRFVLNEASAIPLTAFLCLYPLDGRPGQIKSLWQALNHATTQSNLAYVGKSYGRGAIKVEPRQLERLEVPIHVLEEVGWQHDGPERLAAS